MLSERLRVRSIAVPAALAVWVTASALASSATAEERGRSVLGAQGTVFEVHSAAHSDDPTSEDGLLVLSVQPPGGERTLEIVPGTEDFAREAEPRLLHFPENDKLYVLWLDYQGLHTRLHLISRRSDGTWSEISEVAGRVFFRKERAQVHVTRTGPGSAADQGDRVVHLVWREETGEVFYTALTDDESAASVAAFVNLRSAFDVIPNLGAAVDGPLALEAGRDQRTAVFSFVDPIEGTIEVFEAAAVPAAVAEIARDVEVVLSSQPGEPTPATLVAAGEKARSHIIHTGRSRNERLGAHLGDEIGRFLATATIGEGDSWVSVASAARSHIIHAGLRIDPDATESDDIDSPGLLVDAVRGPDADSADAPSVPVRLQWLASYPLPADWSENAPDSYNLSVSRSGHELVVFWSELDGVGDAAVERLAYREWDSANETWTPGVRLSSVEDLAKAGSLILGRVHR